MNKTTFLSALIIAIILVGVAMKSPYKENGGYFYHTLLTPQEVTEVDNSKSTSQDDFMATVVLPLVDRETALVEQIIDTSTFQKNSVVISTNF